MKTLISFLAVLAFTASAGLGEEEWILDCVEAGQAGGDRRETWADLVGMIERCAEEIPELESLTLKHGPRIRSEKSAAEQM